MQLLFYRIIWTIKDGIKQKYPEIPIHQIDERFTSKIAKQSILASGIKKKGRQNKALVDEVSATIILQNYLDYN